MSGPSSNCPNCGAPIKFAWSSAVQAACPYCQAIIIRRDVNLEAVGTVADLPPDASAIQLMTEGFFDNKHFTVIGRIRYEWEQGNWNEWHLLMNDGTSGWLSDAQADYAVSFAVTSPITFPTPLEMKKGQVFQLQGAQFMVTHLTKVRYVGFEGSCPSRPRIAASSRPPICAPWMRALRPSTIPRRRRCCSWAGMWTSKH